MFGDDADILTSAPVALDKAPVDPNMRVSDVFCSKIIHTNASSASRFQCSQRVHKILEYNGIATADTGPSALMVDDASGSWAWPRPRPRPLKSPYPCFNCHRMFAGPPIFMPERLLNDQFEEDLNFCSGACMNTYIHYNLNDASFATRSANALEYMRKVHGFKGSELGLAPHFSQHVRYGGELTDEQFDAIIGTPALTTRILAVPFIPSKTVIEWTCSLDAEEGDKRQRELHAEMLRVQANLGRRKTAAAAAAADAADADDDVVMESVGGTDGVSVSAGAGAAAMPASHPAMSLEQNLAAASQGNGSVAAQILNCAMGQSATVPPHHRCWQTRNLRQPPLEAIEQRLAALPPLEKHDGAYELYLQEKGGFEDAAVTAANADALEPKVPPSKKARTMASRARAKKPQPQPQPQPEVEPEPEPEQTSDAGSGSEQEQKPEPPPTSKPRTKSKPKSKSNPKPDEDESEPEAESKPKPKPAKPKAASAPVRARAKPKQKPVSMIEDDDQDSSADADADADADDARLLPTPTPTPKPKRVRRRQT